MVTQLCSRAAPQLRAEQSAQFQAKLEKEKQERIAAADEKRTKQKAIDDAAFAKRKKEEEEAEAAAEAIAAAAAKKAEKAAAAAAPAAAVSSAAEPEAEGGPPPMKKKEAAAAGGPPPVRQRGHALQSWRQLCSCAPACGSAQRRLRPASHRSTRAVLILNSPRGAWRDPATPCGNRRADGGGGRASTRGQDR